jgi:hypothetical protein
MVIQVPAAVPERDFLEDCVLISVIFCGTHNNNCRLVFNSRFCYHSYTVIWPSDQSAGWHAGDPGSTSAGTALYMYIWMYTPSAVSILETDMCAIQKFLFHFFFHFCSIPESVEVLKGGILL